MVVKLRELSGLQNVNKVDLTRGEVVDEEEEEIAEDMDSEQ